MLAVCMTLIDSEEGKKNFEKLFLDNKLKAFRAAYKILHNEALAEEAVSEGFFRIAECFHKIHHLNSHKLECYVVITVRNTALNMLKKEHRIETESYDEDIDYNNELPETDYSELLECLSKLSDTDQEILYLRFTLELDYKEIGIALGIADTAARQRVRYAKKKLKTLLEKEEDYA